MKPPLCIWVLNYPMLLIRPDRGYGASLKEGCTIEEIIRWFREEFDVKLEQAIKKGGVIRLKEKEKKEEKKVFIEPELVEHEEKLDEVTMGDVMGSPPGGANGA